MTERGRDDATTWAIGLWPVLEALRHRPTLVTEVVWHPDLESGQRTQLAQLAEAAAVPALEDAAMVKAVRRSGLALAAARVRRVADVLDIEGDHLVLLHPAHAGNVGAALRAALGFGVRDVALVGGRVDPWSPHVLRASQGAAFAVRRGTWATWAAYRRDHPRHAVVAVVPPSLAAHPLSDLIPRTPAAWVFGPEGGRFPEEALMGALRTTIPQDPALESHNLAVAVGIGLYARALALEAATRRAPAAASAPPAARPRADGTEPT